jgi:hypothetical protein
MNLNPKHKPVWGPYYKVWSQYRQMQTLQHIRGELSMNAELDSKEKPKTATGVLAKLGISLPELSFRVPLTIQTFANICCNRFHYCGEDARPCDGKLTTN